jgi:protein-tyrosine phosphatase
VRSRSFHQETKENRTRPEIRVLFICMGNICRSPVAEGVFRRMLEDAGLAEKVQVDSAGTHDYQIGNPPDVRSQATARRRGINLSGLRARQVTLADFAEFDYLLAMDRQNLEQLRNLCQESTGQSRTRLLLEFAPHLPEREVPDPYYGGISGFERVLDLVEEAARGLLAHLRERHRL